MKTLISCATFILTFAVLVNAKPPHPPPPPHIKEMRDACLEEMDMTEKDYHQARKNGEYKNEDCLSACVDKKLGLIGEDGKIDKKIAKTDFPPHVSQENATKIVDACFEQKGENDCETAVLYRDCIRKLIPRPPMHKEVARIIDECKIELSLTDEDIKKLLDSKDEAKEDCFLHCVGGKSGSLNKDGTINKEGLMKTLPPPKRESLKSAIENCAKEVAAGANKCETAVRVRNCLEKNDIADRHHFGSSHPHEDD